MWSHYDHSIMIYQLSLRSFYSLLIPLSSIFINLQHDIKAQVLLGTCYLCLSRRENAQNFQNKSKYSDKITTNLNYVSRKKYSSYLETCEHWMIKDGLSVQNLQDVRNEVTLE